MSNTIQQSLQKYATPIFISSSKNDINSPFSYKDWYTSHQGIIQNQEFKQYNEYLVNWYKSKSQTITDFNLQLRLNYLTLLKQLQLFFSKEEAENWYNNVNLDNEKELLLSIPYFAKKLKTLSLYYLQLRKNVKESKLRYNQVGTNVGIVQQIQKIISTSYSQKNTSDLTLPGYLWNNIPQLSSLSLNLAIELEELYDFHDYFDQSPTVPVSAYYDVTDEKIQNFLESKNLSLSSTDWIYRLGVYPLSSDSYDETEIEDIAKILSEKYLGESKYVSSAIPTQNIKTDVYDLTISPGNNSFFWPGTVYESKALSLPRYETIPLSALNLETLGTPGSSIETADTIFVKTINGTRGAWLRNHLTDYRDETMNATIDPSSKTTFRFPFPGFGLSGEDLPWTGFSLNTDKRYKFLDEETKETIENSYWSTAIELTSVKPLNFNNTTLIENKAYPHQNYNHADKIKVWQITPLYNETNVPNGILDETWLYRFNKTDISVKSGGESTIYWPYEKIDTELDFPDYYPENINEVCDTLAISSINLNFAIAGDSLSSADVIYKITNYKHTLEDAIECCWLSGQEISFSESEVKLTNQSSLQLLLSANNFGYFVWLGNDLTDANNVFRSVNHQSDCVYKNTKYVTYLDHEKCNCACVNFSPFGHPGKKYSENKALTDFIIEDNFAPLDLDLSVWRDENNTHFTQSSAFGWFKTNSDIGWGNGAWVSNDTTFGNKFYLRKGKKYIYYRAGINNLDPETSNLPEYVVRHDYNKQKSNIWVKGKKDPQGNWISDDSPSLMILNPGDLLIYSRTPTTYHSVTGTTTEEINIGENRGSVWSNYDYLTIGENKFVTFAFPVLTESPTPNDPQYPPINYSNILRTYGWTITAPDNSKTDFKNQTTVTFKPAQIGTYTATMTAMSGDPLSMTTFGYFTLSGLAVFRNIPPVEVISTTLEVPTLSAFETAAPGYVINTPLRGWDYNTSTFNLITKKENQGGKPYWAKTYLEKNNFTGFKGVESTGNALRLVDDHNFISQPEFSDINLNIGSKIEYKRNYPVKMNWVQPLTLEVLVDENHWCDLEFSVDVESNLAYTLYNDKNELIVDATTNKSNLAITNIVDNEPVEIVYNAINGFSWQISATPEISETIYNNISGVLGIEAYQPWANLTNLNYPTVAAIPSIEDLRSTIEIGGYFTPSNLGTTVYTNQNFETSLILSSVALSSFFEDTTKRHGNRGLTREISSTLYDLKLENNVWLKESVMGGSTAGTTKKNIFKKYQKFIPYQSGYESNPRLNVGLITPHSKQTPWSGKEDSEWEDKDNYPVSFTGELNVSKWSDAQVLKQAGLQVDNWVTDIFGNQYGLYKNIKDVEPFKRKEIPGEIWVRKNSQFVSPARLSLNGVFDTYENLSIVNELTGSGICKIDMFFDTLLVETSGAIIFEKINYDYPLDNIFSLTDEARYVSLAMPVSSNLDREFTGTDLSNFTFAKAGETWFFPAEKLVTCSVCGLSGGYLTPELYRLNLNNLVLDKIFPILDSDFNLIQSLSSENIVSFNPPVLSFNSLKNEYLLSLLCKNNNQKDLIVEFFIKNDTRPYLTDVIVYQPKLGGLNQNPPVIHHSLNVTIYSDELLNFQCVAENGPVTFTTTEKPGWINASSTGLFTGDPTFAGTYIVYFYVSNAFGPVYYSLIVNVIDRPVIELDFYLLTEGYSALPGDEDGFILQTDEIDEEQKIIIKSPEPLYYLGTLGYSNVGDEDGFILHTEEIGDEEQKIILITT